MPIPDGLELWKKYNTRLLDLHAHFHFPIVSFDASPAEYLESVDRVASCLGLRTDHVSPEPEFFEESLRRETLDGVDPLPSDISKMYENLSTLYREQNG